MRLAQHMAIASPRVRAECIEANEFPELSQRYQVMAVPKIVINDKVGFEGAIPERDFLGAVLQAVAPRAGGLSAMESVLIVIGVLIGWCRARTAGSCLASASGAEPRPPRSSREEAEAGSAIAAR